VTASADGTARLWDAEGAAELHVLSGHGDWLNDAAWDGAGTRVATASWDGTARIWDAGTGKELVILVGHTQGVLDVAWMSQERG